MNLTVPPYMDPDIHLDLPIQPGLPLPRSTVVQLIQAGLAVGEARFAGLAALAWLAAYPGDIPVSLMHAKALLLELEQAGSSLPQAALSPARRVALASRRKSEYERILAILSGTCQADPEYLPAQELFARVLFEARTGTKGEAGKEISSERRARAGNAGAAGVHTLRRADLDTFGDVLALGGRLEAGMPTPGWSVSLRQARQEMASLAKVQPNILPKSFPRSSDQEKPTGESLDAWEKAESLVHQALLANPTTPLAAVTHLQWEVRRELPLPALRSLASLYHDRWPACVQFILLLADAWMDSGETELAVDLLHQAAARDVTGQVARRLWGEDHPYRSLWPTHLEAAILQDLPVPAAVAASMGWNQLPAGAIRAPAGEGNARPSNLPAQAAPPVASSPVRNFPDQKNGKKPRPVGERPGNAPPTAGVIPEPEIPISIQTELEKLAERLHRPLLGRVDGRFPVYVILTTRRGLVEQYGIDHACLIEEAMLRLAEEVRRRRTWSALLFYADEGLVIPAAGRTAALKKDSARYQDPWSLKLALADLDVFLKQRGEMIGAVLIVGGPEIVPFHHLPNPVDDSDVDIPSDNPYASRDANYFIPEWPVGRLPGGKGRDPSLILNALAAYADRHRKEAEAAKKAGIWIWLQRGWEALRQIGLPNARRMRPSLGYTAAAWKQASQSVFRPVGKKRNLLVSPPLQTSWTPGAGENSQRSSSANGREPHNETVRLQPARFGYFNLHGLADAVEWYGQCDPGAPQDGPDYPIALHPQDLEPGENGSGPRSPLIVFSEACYGAHIAEKGIEEALALKFLATGSQAVVGATSIAYGALTDPLTAADLLGYAFWKGLGQGLPVGEALRRAKIHLAREMHRRQGYLDGEDQKTLISFVLYGDPLVQPLRVTRAPKTILRLVAPPSPVKTVCDRSPDENVGPIPPEVMHHVKNVVACYLPGMADAQIFLTHEHGSCDGVGHECPTSQIGAGHRPVQETYRQVVTLQKSVGGDGALHRHYARLTLNEGGKLVKLVVSR